MSTAHPVHFECSPSWHGLISLSTTKSLFLLTVTVLTAGRRDALTILFCHASLWIIGICLNRFAEITWDPFVVPWVEEERNSSILT